MMGGSSKSSVTEAAELSAAGCFVIIILMIGRT